MEDKKKQSVQWDFSSLQDSLDNHYGSPERLLLEAYKGLLFLVTRTDSDVELSSISENLFPINMVLDDIHLALVKKEDDEFALNHPEFNVSKK